MFDWTNFAGYPNELTDAVARNQFKSPNDLAVDSSGNVYVTDAGNFRICKISPSGQVQVLAGGTQGSSDGAGMTAQFTSPYGIAMDGVGNIYVTDNHTVRKITPAGAVATLAGMPGEAGSADGTGSAARFGPLRGIAITSTGTIYLPDPENHTIRKITPEGVVTTYAGKAGEQGGAGGTVGTTRFYLPRDVTLDPSGNLYVADTGNDAIRKITPAGVSSTVAFWGEDDWYVSPGHIEWASDRLYVTDEGYGVIYEVTSLPFGAAIEIVAGVKGVQGNANGSTGTSKFRYPQGLARGPSGALFIADNRNHTVRKLLGNQLSTFAGSVGSEGSDDGQGSSAKFRSPSSICVAADGRIYAVDQGNFTIRRLTPEGVVTTLAGQAGGYGLYEDGVIFRFSNLARIALSRHGYLLTAETARDSIRRVQMDGTVRHAYSLTTFQRAIALTENASGDVVFVDAGTDQLYKINSLGVQTLLAGSVRGDLDGPPGTARFNQPRSLFADASGNVYVADTGNHKIRKVTSTGQVSTVMGSWDGLSSPEGVILDAAGNIYVADTGNHAIRMKLTSGQLVTLGGTPAIAGGQDGRSIRAGFCSPSSLALAADGSLYVADRGNHRISKGSPAAAVTPPALVLKGPNGTVVGHGEEADLGLKTSSESKNFTFTLTNTGASAVNLTGTPRVSVQSANALFYVVSPPPATLAPGTVATFTISVSSSVTQVHAGQLVIPSDDPGQPLLSVTFKLEIVEPARVSFEAAKYVLNQGTEELVVPVHRTGRTAPFSVKLSTVEFAPTAVPPYARGTADVDFQPLSLTLNFAEGEMTKQVPVTLLPRSGTGVPNIHFGLALSAASDGNTISPRASTVIQVMADDSTAPTLALTSPTAKDKILVLPRTITGIAGDAMGLDRVEVSLNGGAPVLATLLPAAKPTEVKFTAEVAEDNNPVSVLTVTAYDLKSNPTVFTQTFDRHFLVRLERQFLPNPSMPLKNPGKFTITGSPKGWGSATSPAGHPAVLAGSQISVSTTIPPGYLFHHWENAPAEADAISHVISFTVPETGVPPMKAVFSANPFLKGGELYFAGGNRPYAGLILPTGDTETSNATVGQLTATLAPTTASLSGKLLMNGGSHSFTALLNGDGSVWFKSGKAFVRGLDLAGLRLSMTWSEDGLQTTVRGAGENISEGLVRGAFFHKERLVSAALMNRSASQGYYTLAWPAKTQSSGRDTSTCPQGAGYASFTLSNQGKVALTGALADGTKITAGVFFNELWQIPLFVQIPTPGGPSKLKEGSFTGTLEISGAGAVTGDGCLWFRPSVVETTKPVTQLYTAGWPEGLQLDAIGSAFHPRLTVQQILSSTTGATTLRFDNGRLVSAVEKTNLTLVGNKVVKTPATDKTVTLKVSPVTGLFSGAFEPNWPQPQKKQPAFQGILLEGMEPSGLGFFISNSMADTDPEAGGVTFSGTGAD